MKINDERIKDWVEKCPEHDHELLHSDDNGIVMVVRFNNQNESEEIKMKKQDTRLKQPTQRDYKKHHAYGL